MFDNREEVLEWLHNNEEYVRYHDPSNGVEEKLVDVLLVHAKDDLHSKYIMQSYLLPF